jgi:hypothetical protein
MGDRANRLRVRQFVSAGILAALLLAAFGAGLGLVAPLHRAEAGVFEAQHAWQHALTEYTLAGERAPDSNDLARVYDEWGEQLSAGQQYAAAIDKFGMVLTTYAGAATQLARAQAGTIVAYLAWGEQAIQQQDYAGAAQHLDTLPYCATSCQTQGATLDATAYYNFAEAKLASGDYSGAVDTFHALLNRFGSAPEAKQAHGDTAKALLGLGQQQISTACATAIPTYQELAAKYADTPQGGQAAAALAQPQPVKGQFTAGVPAGAFAVLGKNMNNNMTDSQFFAAVGPPAPRTAVHADGTFQFAPVAQGTWDLVWGHPVGEAENYTFSYHAGDGSPYWVATVGPLCAYDFGDIADKFLLSRPPTGYAMISYAMIR